MVRCDHCGAECALPFTCQHCGGKYCPDCRLPPNHTCTGISSWNAKPLPSVGVNYGKGGGVSVSGGGYVTESRRDTKKKPGMNVPYLRVMIAVIVLVLLGLAWLVLSGYKG
jgi:uncharacterized protein